MMAETLTDSEKGIIKYVFLPAKECPDFSKELKCGWFIEKLLS